jgi:hypothetical protein
MDGPLHVAYVFEMANKEKKLTFAAAVRIGCTQLPD